MQIKSTMISNKSTNGSNHSTTGSNERIAHDIAPQKCHTVPSGNPGKHAIRPELPYDNNKASDAVVAGSKHNGVPHGSFKPHNSSSTASGHFDKHPFKKSDPACVKC